MKLKPWRLSGMLTHTRTIGEVGFYKNGTQLDIWYRDSDGKLHWMDVYRKDLIKFLESEDAEAVLFSNSDGNAEDK